MTEEHLSNSQLKSFVERIERLNEEKTAIQSDIKEVYLELKDNGFDPKIVRKIVSLRRQDENKRIEEETILDLYKDELGME